jgi:hypothetical protein
MSFDLQMIRDAAPASITMPREHAIYRDAQGGDRKVQPARNVADLLERGHRSRTTTTTAILIDLTA